MRTFVYIDGFNLYYRALKGTAYKWLDLKSMLVRLLPPQRHEILQIKYFTALVSGIADPGQPARQKAWLRAIQAHAPEISVHYGNFMTHEISLPQAPLSIPPQFVRVVKTEEKGSDVNLAVHVVNDAAFNRYDCAAIISNDSDLAEALRLIREEHGKMVGLICPLLRGHPSGALQRHAHFTKHIRAGLLAATQLPSPIPGTTIHKPEQW